MTQMYLHSVYGFVHSSDVVHICIMLFKQIK